MRRYYYGSYGLTGGYGPHCLNIRDADESVYADARKRREKEETSDRCVVLVSRATGLCWWIDDMVIDDIDLMPVRQIDGKQAQYTRDEIQRYEELWGNQ